MLLKAYEKVLVRQAEGKGHLQVRALPFAPQPGLSPPIERDAHQLKALPLKPMALPFFDMAERNLGPKKGGKDGARLCQICTKHLCRNVFYLGHAGLCMAKRAATILVKQSQH